MISQTRKAVKLRMEKFGEKLHILRVSHRMTLKGLAVAIGRTSHGYISEIEAGKKKPNAEFVLAVARLFNVSADELLKDELELRTATISSSDEESP